VSNKKKDHLFFSVGLEPFYHWIFDKGNMMGAISGAET
jgi:hypothetical protein